MPHFKYNLHHHEILQVKVWTNNNDNTNIYALIIVTRGQIAYVEMYQETLIFVFSINDPKNILYYKIIKTKILCLSYWS